MIKSEDETQFKIVHILGQGNFHFLGVTSICSLMKKISLVSGTHVKATKEFFVFSSGDGVQHWQKKCLVLLWGEAFSKGFFVGGGGLNWRIFSSYFSVSQPL